VKVQIIYLDPHEDYVSALDKLSWAKAPRILIVWPRHGRVLTRRLDLALLKRQAQRRGSQVGLVTHDPDVITHAEDLAIPVFDSIDMIQEQTWHRRPKDRVDIKQRASPPPDDLLTQPDLPSPSDKEHILTKISRPVLVGLAFLSLVLLAITLLPRAEITLTPETQIQEIDLFLTLDPEIETVLLNKRIPARWTMIKVNGSLRIPTTGSTAVPASYASGTVLFTNRTSEPVNIPSGTGVRARGNGNLRFVTLEQVNLPGEEESQASATIQATSPGPSGNIPAGQIDAVEGHLGLRIVVTNPEPTTGGEKEIRAAVASDDLSTLERDLTNQLITQATSEFEHELDVDEMLVADSIRVAKIHEKQYDRQIDEPADSVSLSITMEAEALVYRLSDLEDAAKLVLEDNLPPAALPVPGMLNYLIMDEPSVEYGNTASLRISANQYIFVAIDEAHMQDFLRARTREDATRLLKRILHLSIEPDIQLTPKWFPWLPWLGMNISIRYAWEID
jgi:hypothetical protein